MSRFEQLAQVGICSLMGLALGISPSFAHTIKVDEDVAALFHLEPNHNPRADQPAQIWFALTLKGGEPLPLSECDCQLTIYSDPKPEDAEPVLEPELIGLDVERYQDAPGAEVIFPEIGNYVLELRGNPQAGASFQPFELTYPVTVIP